MLASVLIPSRNRPEKLERTVSALFDTVEDRDRIEILVRVDLDDDNMLPNLGAFESLGVTFIVGPRRGGYTEAQFLWNELARLSQGRWLFCLNDDTVMDTPAWDSHLATYEDSICVVFPWDNIDHTSFPMISRKVFETLGHIAVYPGVDTWMCALTSQGIPRYMADEIRVYHERPDHGFANLRDQTWDETREGATILNKQWSTEQPKWDALIKQDKAKLAEARRAEG